MTANVATRLPKIKHTKMLVNGKVIIQGQLRFIELSCL